MKKIFIIATLLIILWLIRLRRPIDTKGIYESISNFDNNNSRECNTYQNIVLWIDSTDSMVLNWFARLCLLWWISKIVQNMTWNELYAEIDRLKAVYLLDTNNEKSELYKYTKNKYDTIAWSDIKQYYTFNDYIESIRNAQSTIKTLGDKYESCKTTIQQYQVNQTINNKIIECITLGITYKLKK